MGRGMDARPSPLSTVAQYWRDGIPLRTAAQRPGRPGHGRPCDFGEGAGRRRAPSHREPAPSAPVLLARLLLDAFGLDALDLLHVLAERRAERPGQVPQRLDLPVVLRAADPLVPGVEMPVRLLQQRPGPGQPVAVFLAAVEREVMRLRGRLAFLETVAQLPRQLRAFVDRVPRSPPLLGPARQLCPTTPKPVFRPPTRNR